MPKHLRNMLYAAGAMAPWLVAMPALGADASKAPASEEVIVTAEKRSQAIQEVPAAITAVSGNALREQGISNIRDLASKVPNMNWSEVSGTSLIAIRGIGITETSGLSEPAVALYIDGVFLPRTTMATARTVDVKRVEVLRGPQGTLYGRNATGGAINFISQEPSETFTGGITLMTGSRNDGGTEAFFSGPITDGLLFRVSGGFENQTGFVKAEPSGQHLNGQDVRFGRAALRLEPTDNVTVDLALRYERQRYPNAYHQILTPTNLATPLQSFDPRLTFADQPFHYSSETTIGSATINWGITDDISLKSITSFVNHDHDSGYDADATGLDYFNVPNFPRSSDSVGQEFNLTGKSGRFQWLVGAYYFHEDASVSFNLRLGNDLGAGGLVLLQSVATKTTSYAAFANATFSISDSLRLQVGLRYNDESQKFAQDYRLQLPGGTSTVPGSDPFANGPVFASADSQKFLPKVGIEYDLSKDVHFYAQFSQGYKSGGQNLEGGSGQALGALGIYKAEKLNAYEAGLKSQWFDRQLTVNLTAFHYDYTDMQIFGAIPPFTSAIRNGDAENYGVELEGEWRATDDLTLNFGATFQHGRFTKLKTVDDARPALGLVDLAGSPIPRAPDMTFDLGAEYRIDMDAGPLSEIVLRGNAHYSDDVVLRYNGQPNDTQRAYAFLNVSSTLQFGEHTSLDLFVNNVTNEVYKLHIFYIAPTDAFYGNYAPPRTWGLRLSYDF